MIKTRGECYSESNNRKVLIFAKFYFPLPQFIIKISRCQARCFGWLDKLPGIVLHNHKAGGSSIPEQVVVMLWLAAIWTSPPGWFLWLVKNCYCSISARAPARCNPSHACCWDLNSNSSGKECEVPIPIVRHLLQSSQVYKVLYCFSVCVERKKKVWTQFRLNNTGLTYYECKDCKRKQ